MSKEERLDEIRERKIIRKDLEKKGITTMWCPRRNIIMLLVFETILNDYREVGYMKNNKITWRE